MKMKWKIIEHVASRRTFSGLLCGCVVLTEYTKNIRGYPVAQLIFKLDRN